MKAKILSAIIILAGFIIVITSQIIVAIDTPHNARTTYPVEAVKVKQ